MQVDSTRQRYGWWVYFALVGLIAGGYWLFRIFATGIMPAPDTYNLLVLAVIAGVASFFSPCAFPLLPGYLSVYYTSVEEEQSNRTVMLGGAAALGIVTFNLALGLIIALLGAGVAEGLSISGAEPSTFTRLLRGAVGVILVVLGIAQFAGVNLKPRLADAFAWRVRPRRERLANSPALTLYLYGLGYNIAGIGCTGPIMAALMIAALGAGGFTAALGAFVVFSATMAALMLLISVLVAGSQHSFINRLKASTPAIKRVSSALLVGVGLFNIVSVIFISGFISLLFP